MVPCRVKCIQSLPKGRQIHPRHKRTTNEGNQKNISDSPPWSALGVSHWHLLLSVSYSITFSYLFGFVYSPALARSWWM